MHLVPLETRKIAIQMIKLVKRWVLIMGTINHIVKFIALSLLKIEVNSPSDGELCCMVETELNRKKRNENIIPEV